MATVKAYKHKEDNAAGMLVHILSQYEHQHRRSNEKFPPHAFTFRQHAKWIKQCHIKYQGDHGNL